MNYTLTKEKYHSILQRHAIPSDLKWCGKGFIFQQDNGPKHAVTLCQVCLKSRGEQRVLTCMTFPSQSPDVSLTEHLWEYLKRQKVKATVTSHDSRWDVLRKTAWIMWTLIFSKTCRIHASQEFKLGQGRKADSNIEDFITFIKDWKGDIIANNLGNLIWEISDRDYETNSLCSGFWLLSPDS